MWPWERTSQCSQWPVPELLRMQEQLYTNRLMRHFYQVWRGYNTWNNVNEIYTKFTKYTWKNYTKFRGLCVLQTLNNLITKIWPKRILPSQTGSGVLPVTACSSCIGCGLCLRASGGSSCWLLSLPAVEPGKGIVQKEFDFLLSEPGWSGRSLRWVRWDPWIEQQQNIRYMSTTAEECNWSEN